MARPGYNPAAPRNPAAPAGSLFGGPRKPKAPRKKPPNPLNSGINPGSHHTGDDPPGYGTPGQVVNGNLAPLPPGSTPPPVGQPGTTAAGATDEAVKPTPPPQSYGTASARQDSYTGLGFDEADWNRTLRNLALGYGGVDSVEQYGQGYDENGNPIDNVYNSSVLRNDPLSKLSGIDRSLNASGRTLADNLNDSSKNDLFSGNHAVQQQTLNDEAGRLREQARRDYEQAVADIRAKWVRGTYGRNRAFSDATNQDITDANANAPDPEVTNAPASNGAAGAAPNGQPTTAVDDKGKDKGKKKPKTKGKPPPYNPAAPRNPAAPDGVLFGGPPKEVHATGHDFGWNDPNPTKPSGSILGTVKKPQKKGKGYK